MNKIKIDNYYKPESKTLRLDELDYTIIPNSDIKPLLDKLQQENKRLNGAIQTYDILLKANVEENNQLKDNWNKLKEIAQSQSGLKKQCYNGGLWFEVDELLDKMQEIEGSGSDGNN